MFFLHLVKKNLLKILYSLEFFFSKNFKSHVSLNECLKLGNNFKKKNPFNSNIKKKINNFYSDKFFIIGPSLVRSFSICDKFIPIFVDHALRSTFLTKKLSQETFVKYQKAMTQLNKGSKIIFCMSMQDPDIHLRNEFKTSNRNTDELLKFASKENINLAKYAKENLNLKVYYLLGWPHVKKRASDLVKKYNLLLKKECEKNSIKILDISKFMKGKNGNIKKTLCSIPNDVHPKTIISKFLFKVIYKKNFNEKNQYKWNSLLKLTFSNQFNFRIWPIPYIGETNSSYNRLVQYCNIKDDIASIINGFAIDSQVKKYMSLNSSEIKFELSLGKDLFDEISVFYTNKKKKEIANEIKMLSNRKEIKTYNFSKLKDYDNKKIIIFLNLFESKKKECIELIDNNISKNNNLFIFGNTKDVDKLIKLKKLKQKQNMYFDNRFLLKDLKNCRLCRVT